MKIIVSEHILEYQTVFLIKTINFLYFFREKLSIYSVLLKNLHITLVLCNTDLNVLQAHLRFYGKYFYKMKLSEFINIE